MRHVPGSTSLIHQGIQGLTSNPENFIFGGHRKSIDSSQCGMDFSNQDCKALQRVVRLAEHISGSALPSLQDIYFKRCKSRAAKTIMDSNHPGNRLFFLTAIWQALPEHDGKNWETEEKLLPPGHQTPKLKLGLIKSTWLNLIISKIFIILHHSLLLLCKYPVQPVCTFFLHITAYIIFY